MRTSLLAGPDARVPLRFRARSLPAPVPVPVPRAGGIRAHPARWRTLSARSPPPVRTNRATRGPDPTPPPRAGGIRDHPAR